MNEAIVDIKNSLSDKSVYMLLAPSVYNPTPERLLRRAEEYRADDNIKAYAFLENGEYRGIIVFTADNRTAVILDIAVKPEYRGRGIGSRLADFLFDHFMISRVIAETDDDAVVFYQKYGFAVADTQMKFDTKRHTCVYDSMTRHYDLLIDENNDPVHDSKPARDDMDRWDGPVFIEKMNLDNKKSVLEIGVGTGRLAVRTAPLCAQLHGIDISSRTIGRARENLSGQNNVKLYCGDFLTFAFSETFDVIYSSLTFLHIAEKQKAMGKIAALLKDGGRLVLSICKNREDVIDYGTRKIWVFPDTPEEITSCIQKSGLLLTDRFDTEYAHIFVAVKENECYCGHDCSRCVTYLATLTDDDALREQSREFYKNLLGKDIALNRFHCKGGRTDEVFELCLDCPFRKCCGEKNISSCGLCPEYPCAELLDYQIKYVNQNNQIYTKLKP